MVHPPLRAVVLVRDVVENLLGRAPVGWRERLVPRAEEERVRRRNSVLWQTKQIERQAKHRESKGAYSGDLGKFALSLEAETIKVEVVKVVVEWILAGRDVSVVQVTR